MNKLLKFPLFVVVVLSRYFSSKRINMKILYHKHLFLATRTWPKQSNNRIFNSVTKSLMKA